VNTPTAAPPPAALPTGAPHTSNRTRRLGTENAFVVLAEVAALQAEGREVLSFCIGQPDFPTPRHICDAAIRAIHEGKHGYTPSAGIPQLRAAVARSVGRTHGLEVSPDDVVIAAGAKPFIGYAIASTTDFGARDEVVYPVPGFPIYESQIVMQGAVPVPLHLREANGFRVDPERLRAVMTPRTRLVILNTPHNPTGALLSAADLDGIAAVLREFPDAWVYADEVYCRLVYDGTFGSIASRPGMAARTILTDGCSKTWAMTGWRLGWAVNRALATVLTRHVTNTESCANHMTQWAAIAALDGPQDDAMAMKDEFLRRRDLIVRLLNDVPGVRCASPGGAFYVWPNVSGLCERTGCADSEALRKRLLREAGVAVLSDVHFGARVKGDGQHIRFSYAASQDNIARGVERMAEFAHRAAS